MSIKWSAFPAGSAIAGADIPVGLQSGLNVQWNWDQVRAFLLGTATSTLSIAAGRTLTVSNTLTFTGTNGSTVAFGAGGTVLYAEGVIPLTIGTTTITGGATTQVLFNDGGVLGNSSGFTFNKTTGRVFFGSSQNMLANNGVTTVTGTANVAFGSEAGASLTSAQYSVAIGQSALFSNATADYNTAVGQQALYGKTGAGNVGVGHAAFAAAGAGQTNTGIGTYAGTLVTTGSNNSAVGAYCLQNLTTGASNVAIGYGTGGGITTGDNNTILGANVTGLSSSLTGAVILATGAGTIVLDYNKSTASRWTSTGTFILPVGSSSAPSISNATSTNTGLFFESTGTQVALSLVGGVYFNFAPTYFRINSTTVLGWVNGAADADAPDTVLARDAANTLALRNGTSAQAFNVYNTYANGGTDVEYGQIFWQGNLLKIRTAQSGAGAARGMLLGTTGAASLIAATNDTNRWIVDGSAGHLLAATDNTYDIGASGATRPKDIFAAGAITAGGLLIGSAVLISSGNYIGWSARALMYSPVDGIIELVNQAGTDFSRLQFGGTTASFPALKRSTTELHARFADDSDYTDFRARDIYSSRNTFVTSGVYLGSGGQLNFNNGNNGSLLSPSDGVFLMYDGASTSFSRLMFGGSTSSYPALGRSGTSIVLQLADGTLLTPLTSVGTATLQLGAADAAAPVAQQLNVQGVSVGTNNTAGANWLIRASGSTGSAAGGKITFQTTPAGAGGTSQNSYTNAFEIETTAITAYYAFVANTTLYANQGMNASGNNIYMRDANDIRVGKDSDIGWTDNTDGAAGSFDLVLSRGATGVLKINQTPTANSSAATTITNGADSSSNCGHRIQINFNGTPYWIPCSSVAF